MKKVSFCAYLLLQVLLSHSLHYLRHAMGETHSTLSTVLRACEISFVGAKEKVKLLLHIHG